MWKSAESQSQFEDPEAATGNDAAPLPRQRRPQATSGPTSRGDAWLVEQVRSGDDNAFAALVVALRAAIDPRPDAARPRRRIGP